MKYTFVFICLLFTISFNSQLHAQDSAKHKAQSFLELGYGLNGDAAVLSTGYYRHWKLSQTKKVWQHIYIGTGARFNSFGGKDIYLVSSKAGIYKTTDEDSILAPAPAIYSVNTFLNIGYQITPKLQAGFDIDVIGLSFGPNGSPTFISNGQEQTIKVNPTPINTLGINASNIGSLLSNIYVRYNITSRWGLCLSSQKTYAEIKTEEVLQTEPTTNQRFRYVSRLVGLGVSYHFK